MPTPIDYRIILGSLPQWLPLLSESAQWQMIKDEMRLTVVRNPGLAPVQETRTYVQGCLAFFGLADEEQALGVTQFLDGYLWPNDERMVNGYVWHTGSTTLKAWLIQGVGKDMKQIYGPVDPVTGYVLPAPVPCPPPVQRQRDPYRAVNTIRNQRGASCQPTSMANTGPGLPTTRIDPSQPVINPNAWTNGPGHHHRHAPQGSTVGYHSIPGTQSLNIGPVSPNHYLTARIPRMSVSSRGSTTINPPLTPTSSTFSRGSSIVGTPPRSAKGSISSTSNSSSTLIGVPQLWQIDANFTSLELEQRSRPNESFTVTMGNLKPKTKREEVNDVLEQSVGTYLQYEMTLVESREQTCAEITFMDKTIANQVVHSLNDYRFKDRKLQLRLAQV